MKKTFISIFLFLILLLSNSFAQQTLYVSKTGSNTAPYNSLATAATNVETAVYAASSGDLVLVDDGTYLLTSTIVVSNGVTIRSLNGAEAAVIDGNNSVCCFYMTNANAVIDGFTITNGNNPGGFGGGVRCDNGIIQNCIIENNSARDGGGVALDNSGMIINCIIRNNTADWGGGVRCFNGTVRGCLITGNTANPYGGGVNIWSGGIIQNCTITNNTAANGSGIRLWNNGVVENSVIYSNNGSPNYIINEGSGNSLSYSCTTPLYTGTGNISDDPLFVNAGGGDFSLSGSSPLINAGHNSAWMNSAKDLSGKDRILDGTVDIGAYEFESIIIGGPIPIASWPVGNPIQYINPPTLYWYLGLYAPDLTYEIQCIPVGNPWPETYAVSNEMFYTLPANLTGGVQYTWRVRSVGNSEKSEWSQPAFFTMVSSPVSGPVVPILSWPVGNPTQYVNPPTLNWYLGVYAAGLTFEIQCVPYADNWTNDFLTSSALSFTLPSGLEPGTHYKWRVRSVLGTEKSSWSDTAEFTMVSNNSGQPIVPIPSWPVNNPTEYNNPPTLYWYLAAPGDGLTFEIQSIPASESTWPDNYSTSVTTFYTISNELSPGVQYQWRVRSVNGTLKSNWSTPAYFTMVQSSSSSPKIPIASWPTGNTTEYNNPPALYWYLGADPTGVTFEVQYMLASENTWANDFFTSSTFSYLVTSNLTYGAQYKWRVRSVKGSLKSDWSIPVLFTMASNTFPVQPVIGSPSNSATISFASTGLYWYLPTSSRTNSTYEIQLADNPEFNNAKEYSTSELNINVEGLERGKSYYWKVRSKNETGKSSYYSGVSNFNVNNSLTDVAESSLVPTSFNLSQNYPNPFNPSTRISYSIPKNSFVSLVVYDMLGREVKTLVRRELTPGTYSIDWKGEDNSGNKVSSGTYIYRITAGSFISSGKMIMLK